MVLIGRYQLRGLLGRGAWAEVYLAWDPLLGRELALKVLLPETAAEAAVRRHLAAEVALLAALDHPNLVTMYDADLESARPFFTMKLLDGGSSADLITGSRRPPLDRVAVVIAGVAAALDYLHSIGRTHGDIKATNVLFDHRGHVLVIDCGLSRPFGAHASTPGEVVAGTPAYMAPELLRGELVGGAADIYALGTLAYTLLAGRTPFTGDTPEVLYAQANRPVPPLHTLRPGLPDAVLNAVGWSMAKEPWRRPARAGMLAEALLAASGSFHQSVAAPPPTQAPPMPPIGTPPPPFGPAWASPQSASAVHPDAHASMIIEVSPTDSMLARAPVGAAPSPAGPPLPPDAEQTIAGETVPPSQPADDDAPTGGIQLDSTVFAPSAVAPGESFLVQVFAHQPDQADAVLALAREFDADAVRRGFTSLSSMIVVGQRLMFSLTLPGLVIDNPVQFLVWMGRPQSVQFGVTVPEEYRHRSVIGTVTISLESVPIGHVKFKVAVRTDGESDESTSVQPVAGGLHRYRKAFISYASFDRSEVLKRVQMLARMEIEYFQDVLALEPGERWERSLYRHIDECDLFLLFWSNAAKASPWVIREVRYAVSRKRGDDDAPPEILPVIIEGPPVVPPPEELAHLHFDDRLLYFMPRTR